MANISAKFDKEAHNSLVTIVFTSLLPYIPIVTLTWPLISEINRVHPLIMANMSAKFDKEKHNCLVSIVFTNLFPYKSIVTLTFQKLISIYVFCDLDSWPLTSKINRVHRLTMVNMSAKFDKKNTQRFSFYPVYKLISIYVHFDLDLWPLTSIINRVHPLIIVNMSEKFDIETRKGVVSIVFTMSMHGRTDARTHGTTAALLYPHRNALRRDN